MTVQRCCWIAFLLVEIFSEGCAAPLHVPIDVPSNQSNWTNMKENTTRAILFERLSRAFSAMAENLDDIDVDAYFGIILAKAQLDGIQKESNINNILDFLIEKGPTINHPLGSNLNNVARHILNAKNWLKIGTKLTKLPNCKKQQNYKNQMTHSSRNSPNETESDPPVALTGLLNQELEIFFDLLDMCLSQLIDEAGIRKKTIDRNFSCEISEQCHQIMTLGRPWGYSLTHRVIYFLVGESQGCKKKSVGGLCCNIMKEILHIESNGFPSAMKDLFMEQVLVCALSGYSDFLQSPWLQWIFSWQTKEGCWGIDENPKKKLIQNGTAHLTHNIKYHIDLKSRQDLIRLRSGSNVRVMRTRRSTQSLGEGGCSSHMTGIGVALLAFAARHDGSINFD